MKSMWPTIHAELKAYIEAQGDVPALAECVPCSPDYLYKLARNDRGTNPGHRIVNGLGKCLDVKSSKVYAESMENPEHVAAVLELEDGAPDVLVNAARLVKEKGAQSPEVEKLRSDLLFLLGNP